MFENSVFAQKMLDNPSPSNVKLHNLSKIRKNKICTDLHKKFALFWGWIDNPFPK